MLGMGRSPRPTNVKGVIRGPEYDAGGTGDRALMDALFADAGQGDVHALIAEHATFGCRHRVAESVLRSRTTRAPSMPQTTDPMFELLQRFMARVDGDRHQAVRALFARVFTPRRAARYRTDIEQRSHALIDRVEADGAMDLVADYARPLPFGIIADVLGVPAASHPWLEEAFGVLGAAFAGQRDPARVVAGNAAATELIEFFDRLFVERATHPADDLITLLASDDNSTVDRGDLLANCVFFMLAGHTTSTTLLTAGATTLLEYPHQLRALMDHPPRWSTAVDELVRFVSPITLTGVGLDDDIVIDGENFRAGANRLICYAGANRDREVFDDPDRLDITRTPNPHLGFSVGAHHCVGAPLARLNAEVGMSVLFHRLPDLHTAGLPVWTGHAPVRQIVSQPVRW